MIFPKLKESQVGLLLISQVIATWTSSIAKFNAPVSNARSDILAVSSNDQSSFLQIWKLIDQISTLQNAGESQEKTIASNSTNNDHEDGKKAETKQHEAANTDMDLAPEASSSVMAQIPISKQAAAEASDMQLEISLEAENFINSMPEQQPVRISSLF